MRSQAFRRLRVLTILIAVTSLGMFVLGLVLFGKFPTNQFAGYLSVACSCYALGYFIRDAAR